MRTEPGTLDTLLPRIADGDRAAFDALYRALASRVLATATALLRAPEHAQEVCQEVFLHVWTNAHGFDPRRGSATSWVLTVTRGKAIDRVRSEESARARERRHGAIVERSGNDPVHETVRARWEGRQVRAALGTLSPVQRQAVELAWLSGLSHPEVARRVQAPLGTVKARIRDGMARMRAGLQVTV